MNINLSGIAASKQVKKKKHPTDPIGFGLNRRRPRGGTNVLMDGSDNDSSSSSSSQGDNVNASSASRRSAVNRALKREQEVLRQRAQIAMKKEEESADNNMYDYDGAYDSFHPEKKKEQLRQEQQQQKDSKKSRYVEDLLRNSEKRNMERDVVYERLRVATEQKEEEADSNTYHGKEKFVTAAYQRKLEERALWQASEKKIQEQEDAEDVTKNKTAGAAMANFYGNFSKNVAMGMRGSGSEADKVVDDKDSENIGGNKGPSFTDGFELEEEDPTPELTNGETNASNNEDFGTINKTHDDSKENDNTEDTKNGSNKVPSAPVLSMRQIREEKVAQARIRYFKRKQDQIDRFST